MKLDRRYRWHGAVVAGALAMLLGRAVQGEEAVRFATEVRPLFNEHCVACHGGVKQAGDLSFIYREKLLAPAKSGKAPVVPGQPDQSELLSRVTAQDENERMPPPEHGPALSGEEIETLRRWIEQGARWEEHWAYQAPARSEVPQVQRSKWVKQPMDQFVLAQLEEEGLEPAEPAGRAEWLRRVSFDLNGLPPTEEELTDFLQDQSPGAFERAADRLLAAPAYGERWASLWMDLARYADSQGYEKDGIRTMWPYRDWVVKAFNADMPFDEFTVRQLAGDLLPNPTMDDLIATAFHRNTPTNVEGGTDDEEFRVVAVMDRVSTTWEVWQGVTFKCVQCHSHPYDPIEHEEYYQFMDFFNSSRDWDLREELPVLKVPRHRSDYARARQLDAEKSRLRREAAEETEAVSKASSWSYLFPDRIASSEQTRLVVRLSEKGHPEVHTEGTVSHDSRFVLEFPLGSWAEGATAIRVEVIPKDLEKARFTPELGFEISEVRAQWMEGRQPFPDLKKPEEEKEKEKEDKDQQKEREELPGEIRLVLALGDEAEPFFDADRSLNEDKPGWGAHPRLTRPRSLVLVLDEPLRVGREGRLRLHFWQKAAPNDLAPLVMNRSRYAVTTDSRWLEMKAGDAAARRERIAAIEKERGRMETAAKLPLMLEQPEFLQRATARFVRGNWLDKGEQVQGDVPALFGGLPADLPKNRLGMAQWLVSGQNPLTARVAVNRFWEQLFGRGLVETLGDFGSSGLSPSHPALLDDLALRFQNEMRWSIKQLLREMVLSATYRQGARFDEELRLRDPGNRLYARGPRSRLTAEMIRDNALLVSGLLAVKMEGEPVMPPQPDGVWRAARSNLKWKTSEGADRYRRALYTFWRRLSAYPGLTLFDAPSRIVCTVRRVPTNTPLQALVTLNDPAYMECAAGLADRVMDEGGNVDEWLARAYELAAGRRIERADLEDLNKLYDEALAIYEQDEKLVEETGRSAQGAAMALVANAILNLDAVLTK